MPRTMRINKKTDIPYTHKNGNDIPRTTLDYLRIYDIVCHMIYDIIYLLTANGLPPGGSSTIHIYTQTIHRTTQLTTLVGRLSGIRTQSSQTNWVECGPCPVFASIPWHLPYK